MLGEQAWYRSAHLRLILPYKCFSLRPTKSETLNIDTSLHKILNVHLNNETNTFTAVLPGSTKCLSNISVLTCWHLEGGQINNVCLYAKTLAKSPQMRADLWHKFLDECTSADMIVELDKVCPQSSLPMEGFAYVLLLEHRLPLLKATTYASLIWLLPDNLSLDLLNTRPSDD